MNTDTMKQIIIVRKDLDMSPGKLAAQVSHASMAFLTHLIRNNTKSITYNYKKLYTSNFNLSADLYENWINGVFTKVILEAKNKNQLLKAVDKAKELGFKENEHYFLIKDNCYTELEPEEVNENGIGRTLTCIGFLPMHKEIIEPISKKYQLLK